jgi:hypothetical protein
MFLLVSRFQLGGATRGLLVLGLGMGARASGHAQGRPVSEFQAAVTLPPRLTALDSANGFRAYTFGTRLSEWPTPLPGLRATRHGQLTAQIPTEPVVIGDLILRGVRLSFYNGRLARLTFALTSQAYAAELLRVLLAQYGAGDHVGFGRVAWRGQVVTLLYELVITNRGGGRQAASIEQGQVSLVNNALQAEAQAEQATRAK